MSEEVIPRIVPGDTVRIAGSPGAPFEDYTVVRVGEDGTLYYWGRARVEQLDPYFVIRIFDAYGKDVWKK